MTPELLWKLSSVSGVGLTKDKTAFVYTVSTPDAAENKSSRKTYILNLSINGLKEIISGDSLVANTRFSPDGKYTIASKEIKLEKIYGKDFYPDLQKSTVQIYDGLGYRHWDEREDGTYGHVFIQPVVNGKTALVWLREFFGWLSKTLNTKSF